MNSDVECCMLLFKFRYKAEPQDISVLPQEKNLTKVTNKTDYNKKQNKQKKQKNPTTTGQLSS